MVRRAILAVIAWISLVSAAGAAGTLTFPPLTGRVVDEAGLLSPADQDALTQSLAALEAKTTDQLVVVTLKSLQGTSIDDYGYQLGRAWGIGQKGKNNGALLIVAPAERKVRIEVGYGLEGTLTDAYTKVVIERVILPRFKAGDYPGGIKAGTAELIRTLGGPDETQASDDAQQTAPAGEPPGDQAPGFPVILVILGGVGLLIICAVVTSGGICRFFLQTIFFMLLSGRGGSGGGGSGGGPSFGGGGGSFGGGGSSGSW